MIFTKIIIPDLAPEKRQKRDEQSNAAAFDRARANPCEGRRLASQCTTAANNWAREAEEFERSAAVFRRLSSVYADRAAAYRKGSV